MSDIIQALLNAVETREIDLGECASMYEGVKLPVRVNWTRGHKKQRFTLNRELSAIREDFQNRNGADIEPLNKRANENAAAWMEWWADVFMMRADDVTTLKDALPDPHWEWLTNRIVKTVSEYEVAETKKVGVLRGRSSGEQERKPPTSGTDSTSPDG